MKRCPECGTEYEDHVPLCLADGAELVSAEPALTPAPVPAGRISATPAPAQPVAEESRSGGGGVLLLVGGAVALVVLLLAGVGVVVATGALAGEDPPQPEPIVFVEPAPDPVPDPEPVAAAPVDVAFVTIPEGAELFENDQLVCAAPCSVPHPSHAPLPRTFVVKANGYLDKTFVMEEAAGPYLVELSKKSRPRPVKPTNPRPVTPSPGPRQPRPSIGRDRGDGG